MSTKAKDILFIDIETVPQYPGYEQLPMQVRGEWERKCLILSRSSAAEPAALYEKAGIYAEFGKIVCVSAGWFEGKEVKTRSFFGDDEQRLLFDFSQLLNSFFSTNEKRLCAHNGKEFDFPYLGRRILINGLPLPEPLRISGKKPWEIKHLDTMELWKFGDYKNYTSLSLLASVFDIPSPKNEIDGGMVREVYWDKKDLERIVRYCEQDVETVARLYLKLAGSKEETAAL